VLNTLLILGAGQGIFLGLLLLSRRVNSTANKVLALVMFVSSVFLLYVVFYSESYYSTHPHLIGFGQPLVFLFGPTLYLYALLVATDSRGFNKLWLLHFLPYVLNMLYFLPFIFSSGEAKLAMVSQVMQDQTPLDIQIIENLKYVHGIIYVALTMRLLQFHSSRLKERFSSIERINLNWLRYLTIGIVAVWAIAIGEHVLSEFGLDLPHIGDLTAVAVAVFVYAIGYLGLRQPEVFGGARMPTPAFGLPVLPNALKGGRRLETPEGENQPVDLKPEDTSKYKKSGLTPDRADAILNSLLSIMEEQKPFSRSTLTLQDLSDELRISAHNLSEVINTRLQKNFFDFVNGFRVKEVKRRLEDPQYDHLTILAIAQDVGFNSKSSFNTIFKKLTDTTPSEYRKQARKV
jgi:AraC-like DNA-binding protein